MKIHRFVPTSIAVLACLAALGCASQKKPTTEEDFYTSGNREADQRAEQRMTTTAQLRGESDSGKKGEKGRERQRSLYERLGGESGIGRIVDDFVDRAIADPRVNWERIGEKHGGVLGIGAKSVHWAATPDHVSNLKTHMREFIVVATGGPTRYAGRDVKQVHSGMGISNAEFDATIGDLKATLDALRVPTPEQKELLSVLESTRAEVVEER